MLLAVAFAPAGPAAAVVHRARLADIQDEVMCPVCGVPLSIAGDAPLAQRERVFITVLIDRGMTKPQIMEALVRQFGPGVLTMPRNKGFGRTAYLAPAGAALAGLALAICAALRWRRRLAASPVPAVPSAEADWRLNADLESYDL